MPHRNNSTEPRRETETEGDGARNVVNGPWSDSAPEINIGQNVQGHVYADKLILNIGGTIRQLTELTDAQVDRLRAVIGKSLRLRNIVLDSVRCLFSGMLLGLWTQIPGWIRTLPIQGQPVTETYVTVMTVAMSAISVYMVYRVQCGPWAARQRNTIRELEKILAKIDAERDMRRANMPMDAVGLVRKVLSILRE